MSYSRFGEADVYVYLDVAGYLNCCACSIVDEQDVWGNFRAYDTEAMVSHLKEHRKNGDRVLTDTIERLWADHEENMEFILKTTFKHGEK
jgi:hypothetical protein